MTKILQYIDRPQRCSNYAKSLGKRFIIETKKPLKLNGELRMDTVEFTPYFEQEKKIQEEYKENGFNYLLPNELWSNHKIFHYISLFGKEIEKLENQNRLNKKNLQKAIHSTIPDSQNKIAVRTMDDLLELLKQKHPDPDEINFIKNNFNGMQSPTGNGGSSIGMNFDSVNSDNLIESTNFKILAQHETTHALKTIFQNECNANLANGSAYGTIHFMKLENHFLGQLRQPLRQIDSPKEELLKSLGVSSTKELHENFESQFSEVIKDALSKDESLNSECLTTIIKFFKDRAEDEKCAYKSDIGFRKMFDDSSKPTTAELKEVLYEELEKFFAQKLKKEALSQNQ